MTYTGLLLSGKHNAHMDSFALSLYNRELIDHINVYETEGPGKNRTHRIVIYSRFVGHIELPEAALRKSENYKADTRQSVAVEYIPKLA